MRPRRRISIVLYLLAALSAAAPAVAQVTLAPPPPKPRTRVLQGEEALKVALTVLIQREQWHDILKLIEGLSPERRAAEDIQLIQAQAWRHLKQPQRALDIYRRLLGGSKATQLLRLELAQTFYEARDLPASEYNFRLALAGQLPEPDRQLAHQYLSRIARERPWRVDASLSVAPDSNVNGATDARDVQIFGLPFTLSDEARRQAGVAVSGALAASGGIVLEPDRKLIGTVYGVANETSSRAFSDEGVGVRAGPEFSHQENRWSVQATGERFWYAGLPLYRAVGAALQDDFARGPVTAYSIGLSAQHLDYDLYGPRDGWLYGLDALRTRYLSSQSFWRAGASLRLNQAVTTGESYRLARVSVGYYHPLILGLAAYVEPAVRVQRNLGPDAIFGIVRQDTEALVSVRLIKQDYSFWGFAPYVGGLADRNWSNIPLYDYGRLRGEIGLSRTF
jgi:hypothetical protein